MQMQWIPTGTVVTAFIGIAGYLGKRCLERRREMEALALLIQAADLRMKLLQSGATLQDLRALQRDAQAPSTTGCVCSRLGSLWSADQIKKVCQLILSSSDQSIS